PALSREIDSQPGVHGATRRTFARKKSHCVRHRLLRNGRRIRRAGREIRSLGAGGSTSARSNRQSTSRKRSDRVRHKLPPPNYRPNESQAKTHGRAARRRASIIASNCGNGTNSKSEYRKPKQASI